MLERLFVLVDFENSASCKQTTMFWHCFNTSHLRHILAQNRESLNTTIVEDAPNFDHSVCICSNEAIHLWKAINSDQGMLMTIKLDNFLLHVRIPHKHFKIKTTRHYNLMLFTVCHFSNCFLVAFQEFDWSFCEIFQ